MPDFTDAAGRVTAWPLQTRTDDTGTEVPGEHFDGKDAATLLGAFTSGIVTPATAFQVLQDTGTNMQVRVGSGAVGDLAFIEGSDPLQGVYSVAWPEADTVVTINAADVSNPRYTSVFLVVAHDQFDTGGFSLPRIATVDGTAEASPSPPAYDGSEKAVLRLADILVGGGVTAITDDDITDERVFSGVTLAGVERLTPAADLSANTVLGAGPGGRVFLQVDGSSEFIVADGSVDFQGNGLVDVGDVDGVDVSAHAARHAPGGGDAIDIEVDNSTEVGSDSVGSTFADKASVTLSIPSSWGSWKCEAWASFTVFGSQGDTWDQVIRIDGTDQQIQTRSSMTAGDGSEAIEHGEAIGGRRTGMATTGSRSVSLRLRSPDGVTVSDIYLYARAVRTS